MRLPKIIKWHSLYPYMHFRTSSLRGGRGGGLLIWVTVASASLFHFIYFLLDAMHTCVMEYGSCTSNNNSMVKLDNLPYTTNEERQLCLQKCMSRPDSHGCEVAWNDNKCGCYSYTQLHMGNFTSMQNRGCWQYEKCLKSSKGI